ncbi:MAG: L,D-transpeptidase family protein [Alphaproteobacteria bacterium]|nr:L,D-transpeptidase family protein [Alphaproteobacteria bacterium]
MALYRFEKPWLITPDGARHRCASGKGGLRTDKREGDGATPIGRWPLREVFYRPDRIARPASRLKVTALSPDMGWCDDPREGSYNRRVALPFSGGHEVLWREDGVYDLIAPLGYNDDPPRPGAGSAIFLHVARADFAPTEGCLAVSLPVLTALVSAFQPGDAVEAVDDA